MAVRAFGRALGRHRFPLQLTQSRCVAKGQTFAQQGYTGGAQTGAEEVHGGDDIHRVGKLIADFSVTTNAIGPSSSAVLAAKELFECFDVNSNPARGGDVKALLDEKATLVTSAPAVEHYPQRKDPELLRLVGELLCQRGTESPEEVQQRMNFGNGASELIDLVCRTAPGGSYSLSPNAQVQYKEYERACKNAGRAFAEKPSDASVIALVNPTNPTGDFMERAEIEAWIEGSAKPGSWVVVDESMIFWAGPNWVNMGVSRRFIQRMLGKNVHVFVIHSWTKIFACTGLRIGSVLCPTPDARKLLESKQVPWSLNVFARTYLKAAIEDKEYLETTWAVTKEWREHIVTRIQRLHPSWKVYGQPWLSWIWIDTGCAEVAKSVYEAALACGCPVRHASAGYELPTFIRIAVRRPSDFAVLYQAMLVRERSFAAAGSAPFGTYADVSPNCIEGVFLVNVDDLRPHEATIEQRRDGLSSYVDSLPVKTLPALIIDSKHQVVIDGHHRLSLFKQSGMSIVPAVFVNYYCEDIFVNPPASTSPTTKDDVINAGLKGEVLPPKSTQHMVRSRGGQMLPILVLAPMIAELCGDTGLAKR